MTAPRVSDLEEFVRVMEAERGMTRRATAEALGVGYTTLWRMLRRRSEETLDRTIGLAMSALWLELEEWTASAPPSREAKMGIKVSSVDGGASARRDPSGTG